MSRNMLAYLGGRPVVMDGRIVPSPLTSARLRRAPMVEHRFELDAAVADEVRSRPHRFGFGAFGEVTYYRTYSRSTARGQERWGDTVVRVVEGVCSIRKDWHLKHGLPWDESRWQTIARDLALYVHGMLVLPPGRGLFAMGTDYVFERGSMALYNCAATDVGVLTFAEDMAWVMDLLMCGVGVGIEAVPKPYEMAAPRGSPLEYVIPDTREGWVESVYLLLASWLQASNPVRFVYDELRPAGAVLRGLGGVSAGAEPLRRLHSQLTETCSRYALREFGPTRLVADVANQIGCCVVMGNIRRSAEILIGLVHDEEFVSLKDYDRHPDRAAWGWMSNNTVRLETSDDFERMPTIADRIRRNGEPGYFNLISTQKYGRVGKDRAGVDARPDAATLLNPCQTADARLLTPGGIRRLGDLGVGDVVWSGTRWTKIVRKVRTGTKAVMAYRTRAGTFYGTPQHRVLQGGERVEVQDAETIDVAWLRPGVDAGGLDPQDVMDGLVVGDGTVHRASNDLVLLVVGKNDQDYFASEVEDLFVRDRSGIGPGHWMVSTTVTADELVLTYLRSVPGRFLFGDPRKVRGFLRGLYSANGSVVGEPGCSRVTLKASSFSVIEAAQEMLSSIGIRSYYTVNRPQVVSFSNGGYECRQSYDLNVTTDRDRFALLVGFIQGYKRDRLEADLAARKRLRSVSKSSYEVVEVEHCGEHEVFDITVDCEEHTYWSGGLLVSNCGEITLEPAEVCNLSEVFPTRCANGAEFLRACRLAALYSSTVSLLPTHSPATNRVVARNRRIGVSVSGVAEWLDDAGAARMTRFLRDGYAAVRDENRLLAVEAGIPESIRVTTCKPSGTISLLAGVSPGVHFPTFDYSVRRIRVARHSVLSGVLIRAGYPCESDVTDPEHTLVFEFPVDQTAARQATDVSVWEQAAQLCTLQREWADNAVSVTLYFDPEREGHQLEQLLAQVAPVVKSVSALPHTDEGVYAQAPYSRITREEYERRCAAVAPIDFTSYRGDGADEKYCSGGVCSVEKLRQDGVQQ